MLFFWKKTCHQFSSTHQNIKLLIWKKQVTINVRYNAAIMEEEKHNFLSFASNQLRRERASALFMSTHCKNKTKWQDLPHIIIYSSFLYEKQSLPFVLLIMGCNHVIAPIQMCLLRSIERMTSFHNIHGRIIWLSLIIIVSRLGLHTYRFIGHINMITLTYLWLIYCSNGCLYIPFPPRNIIDFLMTFFLSLFVT